MLHCIVYCIVFIHFYSASRSMSLSEAIPTTTTYLWHCVWAYTLKRYRQLQVKDLPKVPTLRLERDSKPWPSSRKASILPMLPLCPLHLMVTWIVVLLWVPLS